jgi:hypothetical protein
VTSVSPGDQENQRLWSKVSGRHPIGRRDRFDVNKEQFFKHERRRELSEGALLIIPVIGSANCARLPIMRGSSTPKRGKTTSDNREQVAPPLTPAESGRVTAGYQHWLVRQLLSPNTRRTYLGRVSQYCAYLKTSANIYGNPLSDPHARDYAIRDFKSHLKKIVQG